MKTVKLSGETKDYIWGGTKLRQFNKSSKSNIIAESWELSFHKDGLSKIISGPFKNSFLIDVVSSSDLGEKCSNFSFFPVLNKFIDAKENLSLQVHPSDEYALLNEHSFGKTEMWYVIQADNKSYLYIGFNKDVTKEEFVQRINENTVLEIMNKVEVKAGDCYFIPSGTIHAIGKGCLIYEIQQNSNITYRVYDYDRIDKNGKKRELHIDKAINVINFKKYNPINLTSNPLVNCKYFTVNKIINPKEIISPTDSFLALTVIFGKGKIGKLNVSKGDTIFMPCNQHEIVSGNITVLTTNV